MKWKELAEIAALMALVVTAAKVAAAGLAWAKTSGIGTAPSPHAAGKDGTVPGYWGDVL